MAFSPKAWKDRISEYPNRRTLTYPDNTTVIATVARNEGEITEAGDLFDADNMNDLEQRIDDAIRVTWNTANLKIVTSLPAAPETGVIYLLKE